MKNLKNILILFALVMSWANSFAQAPVIGANGHSNYQKTAMHPIIFNGPFAAIHTTTMTNSDTSVHYIWLGQAFSQSVELAVATVTGTVATTFVKLYGYNNDGKAITEAQAITLGTSVNAAGLYEITGNTTYCAGCLGAGSTTVPGASKIYKYQIPDNVGAMFDNLILVVRQTGTCTATYSAKVLTQK